MYTVDADQGLPKDQMGNEMVQLHGMGLRIRSLELKVHGTFAHLVPFKAILHEIDQPLEHRGEIALGFEHILDDQQ